MERLGTPGKKGILAYLEPMSPEDVQKQREQDAKDKEAARSKKPEASGPKKAKAEPKRSMKKA